MTCAVIGGDKPITSWWLFNNKNISQTLNQINIVPLGDAGSILSITAVHSDHAGEYTCVVKNLAGFAEHSSSLLVNGIHKWVSKIIFIFIYFLTLVFNPVNKNSIFQLYQKLPRLVSVKNQHF